MPDVHIGVNDLHRLDEPGVDETIRLEFWRRGDLRHQLRPNGQAWAAKFVDKVSTEAPGPDPICLETHRRFGKSYFWCSKGSTRCISLPGQFVKYGAPGKEQARNIVVPNLMEVLRYCPQDLRPIPRGTTYRFRTKPRSRTGHLQDSEESVLQIEGLNDNPDKLRGEACDEFYMDEVRDVKDPEYVLNDVISWQFVGRLRPLVGMTSTPPKTMDHPWITKYLPEAINAGRFFRCRASENPDFTKEDEKIVLQIVGSKDSIAWQREAECRHVTDISDMIVPEWVDARKDCIREVKRPEYFLPDAVADFGFIDYTHILFGYVDFLEHRLVIEDEVRVHYETLGQIAARWRERELMVWPEPSDRARGHYRRLADSDPLALQSISKDHHLPVSPVIKYDKDAQLAQYRHAVQQRQIVIDPCCEQLIYQHDNGVWDEKRKKWESSATLGHCDGLAAAVYMLRMARFSKNPYPAKQRDIQRECFVREQLREYDEPGKYDSPVVRAFSRKKKRPRPR